ncbi:hypothetical protein ABT299_20185 [Spirillospora sp. NPDC000708]
MSAFAMWGTAILSAAFLSVGIFAFALDRRPRRYRGRHRAMW